MPKHRVLQLRILESDEPIEGINHCSICLRQLFHAEHARTVTSILCSAGRGKRVWFLCDKCVKVHIKEVA